jgi:hypothetical protein
MERGVVSTRALHPNQRENTIRADLTVLSRLTGLAKKAWDKGRVLIPRRQQDGARGWIARPLARRKSKQKEGAICGSVHSPPPWQAEYFTNPVAYLSVMLTPKTTPDVALSR